MGSENYIFNIFRKIKNFFVGLYGHMQYRMENNRNQYACKIDGEKSNPKDQYNTIIVYRVGGKREVFEISIKDLLADRKLVEQFNPTDAVKLGCIAMGDILFDESTEMRKKKFDEIKRKILS